MKMMDPWLFFNLIRERLRKPEKGDGLLLFQ